MSRASLGRRTLWSREIPSSHTGYQILSAVAETSPLAPVDEDDVEVAERAQLPPAVAAHRHQGYPSGVAAGGPVEQIRSATRRPASA